ncbi:hypothetical protein CLOM_g8574 [Closterium sp. NIES-68]|nr:hypothetical protein CLOM_g8574 [Closterium sp. NIES-68]GJP64590.1 hypothetical protein CLOP_g21567 [Closterium sp. NIES-67]
MAAAAEESDAPRYVLIPLHGTGEAVAVDAERLPADHGDLVDILKGEQAPLHCWLHLARAYFKQGNTAAFLEILSEGTSPDAERVYETSRPERIAMLNALGAYYTGLGRVARRQKRDEVLIKVVDFYNKAARISSEEVATWVGKGQLQLVKGELHQAEEMFSLALAGVPDYVPALLGKACVLFQKGKFQDALNLYKKVLQMHPGCPASVRLGIGLCHLRLFSSSAARQPAAARREFHQAKARQALERVLQLEPGNADALVGLGLLDVNSDDAATVRRGVQRMLAAFNAFPFHPVALNQLANHCFLAGPALHALVDPLAAVAIASTEQALPRAESFYCLARTYHAQGDRKKAFAYYKAATETVQPGEFSLPYYGLGQIQLSLGDAKAALATLEKVLAVHPTNSDALKLVGAIHLQQGRQDQALTCFRKITQHCPSDMDAWLEVGELLVSTDLTAALESLKKAYERMVKAVGKEGVPWQLVNNIAALQHERGAYEEAVEAYKEALGSHGPWAAILQPEGAGGAAGAGGGSRGLPLPVERVTVVFNLALSLERTSQLTQAAALHRLILSQYPSYLDCHLRLAVMALDRRDNTAAMAHISEVLSLDADNVDALLLRSRAEAERDDHGAAKDTLKHIVDLSPEKCTAALVALGNWNLSMSARPTRDTKAEASFLEKAREMFHKALSGNSSNMYAANGVGCVLAERGLFDLAKDIFTHVQEAGSAAGATDLPDVWMNLANVHVAKGDCALAVKLYEKTLKRFFASGAVGTGGSEGTHLRALSYMARAQYDADQLAQCRRSLLLAMHVAPSNAALRFNVAVALQKMAVTVLKQEKRTAEQIRKVVSDLKTALRLFSQLAARGVQGAQGGLDRKKANSHLEYCQHVLGSAKQHLEVAEREEQQRKQRLEAERQVAEVEATKKRAEEDKLMEVERQRRDEEERRLLQQEEEIKRRVEMWKRNDRPKPVDDDDEGGDHGRGEGRSRKDREKERRKEKKRDKHRDRDRDRDRSREREEDGDRKERRKDKKRKKKKKHREARDDDREDGAGWGSDRGNRSDREERDEGENPWVDNERGEGSDGERGEKEAGGAAGNGAGDDALAAAGLVDDEDEGGGHARGDDDERGAPSRKRRRQLADSDEEDAAAPASSPHDATEAPQSHPH